MLVVGWGAVAMGSAQEGATQVVVLAAPVAGARLAGGADGGFAAEVQTVTTSASAIPEVQVVEPQVMDPGPLGVA